MKPPVTILFATVTGNAEGCAIDLTHQLTAAGFACRRENLATYQAAALADEAVAVLLVSTWGDGEPPDDAIPFFDDLQRLPEGGLPGLRYAVFALGDSGYEGFCGFGKDCDRLLERTGATRLRACEECDLDHEDRLPRWAEEIADALAGQPAEAR